MLKSIKIIPVLLALITLTACEEQIDIDIPSTDKKVVVEAEVTTEKDSSYVRITQTADYYSTSPVPVINNATVSVNGVPFTLVSNGLYKPISSFVGVANTTYELTITHEGKTFKATSKLTPMFEVDSVVPIYKKEEGFLKAGYTAVYYATDYRPQIAYTYYQFGKVAQVLKTNPVDTFYVDSLFGNRILFDNASTNRGSYIFELPFLRLNAGDTVFQIFRSVDKNMYEFIRAYNTQTSGAPGPFQAPPANLPTNISGGAMGYFATYDVIRTRTCLK